MSLLKLTFQHGLTLEQARARLNEVVVEMNARFGAMIQRAEWSADRDAVKLYGPGIEAEVRVDAQQVDVTADAPLLGRLLGDRLLGGMKTIVEQEFKRLT